MKDVSEYDKLLKDARMAARAPATIYVPQMHDFLLKENPGMTSQNARHRIERDCKHFWSKRTILAALPPGAKNPVKQKAGMQSRKALGKTSAAESAAQMLNPAIENQPIWITAGGHEQIPDNRSEQPIQEKSYFSMQEVGLPMGKVRSAEEMVSTKSKQGMNDDANRSNEPMKLEIPIPDEKIDSYRPTRPAEDELAKVTKMWILVDRLTGKVVRYGFGNSTGV